MKKKECLLCALFVLVIMCFTGMSVEAAEIVDQGYCGKERVGKNITWTFYSDGVLAFEGSGDMDSGVKASIIMTEGTAWNKYHDRIKTVKIQNGITSIALHAFSGCSSLSNISLPDSIEYIGSGAFSGCRSLRSITLPDSLIGIGFGAFSDCSGLSSIDLPESLTYISGYVFISCTNLSSIYIPLSVEEIYQSDFFNTGLTDIYYAGTREQWNNIIITEDTHGLYDGLGNATIHYNCTDEEEPFTLYSTPENDGWNFVLNKNENFEDIVFSTVSTDYNPRLAYLSAVMSRAAYNQTLIKENLTKLGFNTDNNKKSDYRDDYDSGLFTAYSIARKRMSNSSDIIMITIRGSWEWSWVNNVNIGIAALNGLGKHEGFELDAVKVFIALKDMVGDLTNDRNTYVITGHSQGAAAANLLSVMLYDNGVSNYKVYNYNFACPNVACLINPLDWNPNGVHNNIFNISNNEDPVSDLPSNIIGAFIPRLSRISTWGKFGRCYWFYPNDQTHSIAGHDMVFYVSALASEPPLSAFATSVQRNINNIKSILQIIGIHCPVDIWVYDENGKLVASVIDSVATYYSEDNDIIIIINNDEKYICIEPDNKYNIHFVGSDNGEMTYTIDEVDFASGKFLQEKEIESVILKKDRRFTSEVGGNVDNIKLYVVDDSGERFAEVLEDGTEIQIEPDNLAGQAKIKEFVTRLYINFLKREPDENGLTDWVDALHSGRGTGAKVVSGFVLSPEYKANSLSNEEYITALYRIIFGREPDDMGLNSWIAVMENGCTNKKVLSGFINSNEFENLCRDLGIVRGSYYSEEVADQNEKVAAFVARLYKSCLGRTYEQEGLNSWVFALVSKTSTGSSVVKGFFKSQEFENRKLDDTAFVTVAYRTILGREPDAAGLKDWTNALEKGRNREAIIQGFLNSKEFGNLCQEYDITR